MAIAFDSATSNRADSSGTKDFSVTNTNATMMIVATSYRTTAITYNGVSLYNFTSFDPPVAPVTGSNCAAISLWYLANPTTGTNTLSFTLTGIDPWVCITYTGARATQPESNNSDYSNNGTIETQVGNLTDTVTTLTNNAWAVMFVIGVNNVGRTFTAGSGTTHRSSYGSIFSESIGVLDSNGVVSPAGSKSLNAVWSEGSGFLTSTIISIQPVTVPSAPTIGTASQVNGNLQVTFSDNDNGGSAITGHTATATPGGATATGTSPITFTGLNGGVPYTFKVKATNAIGDSAESSASNAVTLNTGMMAFF